MGSRYKKITEDKYKLRVEKKKNFCKYCNKYILGSSYKFNAHLYVHRAVEPKYTCNHCSKAYYRYDSYRRHIMIHGNLKKLSNVFTCDYCDRSYKDKRNLIVHLRIHDDNIAPNLIRFECKACGAEFSENRVLQQHIRREHFNYKNLDVPLHVERNVNDSWIEKVVRTDTCVQITKVNNNVISIKKCGKIKNETIECKEFNNKNNILRTDNFTSYSKAICDYCKKEMLKKSIRNHIRERHLKIRKFKCSECKRSFNRHYQLNAHNCGQLTRKRRAKSPNLPIRIKIEL